MTCRALQRAARGVVLAVPFVLASAMPFHELIGAVNSRLGVWDELVVLAMVVAWIVLCRDGTVGPRRWCWLGFALGLFVVVGVASALVNAVPVRTWFWQARRLLVFPVVAVLLANSRELCDAQWRRRLLTCIVAVGVVAAAWGLVSYALFYYGHPDEGGRLSNASSVWRVLLHPYTRRVEMGRIQRAVGSFLNPNVFGSYLLVIGTLCVAMLFRARERASRWALAGAAVVVLSALALTNSRGAMVGFAGAMFVLGALRNWRVCLMPVGVGLLVAILTPAGNVENRLSKVTPDNRERLLRPMRAWHETADCRWLGHGLGTRGYSDAQYATVISETGAIGLAAFLLLLGVATGTALTAATGASDESSRWLNAAIAGVCVAGVVQGCAADYFIAPQRACFFWMLVGLSARSRSDFEEQLLPLEPVDDDA